MRTTADDLDPEELDKPEEENELLEEVRELKTGLADLLKAALATKAPTVNVTNEPAAIRVPASAVNVAPPQKPKSATIISHRPDGSMCRYEITFHYEQ